MTSFVYRKLIALTSVAIIVGLCLTGQQASAESGRLTVQQADAQPPTVTYVNCGGGIQQVLYTPAVGFNPLTATDTELVANGLPIRPTSAADLSVWRKAMTHPINTRTRTCGLQSVSASAATTLPATTLPATELPATPAVNTTATTPNWSGYKITGHTYEDAYGYWTLPNVGAPPPPFAALSTQWVGIGQGSKASLPLVQAGTQSSINEGCECDQYYMWWEVVPEFGHQHVIDLGIVILFGNVMYAHIHVSNNNAYITLADVTDSDASATFKYVLPKGTSIKPDGTAEWINERPTTILHDFFPLASGSITFTSAEVSGIRLSKRGVGSSSLSHTDINMWTCTKPKVQMARPLGFAKNGTQFTIKWLRYGHTDPTNCK